MFEAMQSLSFVAGANGISTGDKLLTVANANQYKDAAMTAKLYLWAMGVNVSLHSPRAMQSEKICTVYGEVKKVGF